MTAAPSRILLIKPSSLGDVVHALPVLDALRTAHPAAHIAWLIGSGFAPLLHGHPQIDELIPFDRAHYGRIWRSPRVFRDFCRFLSALRRKRFDLVIDLQGLIRSGFMAWWSGAPRTIGFRDAREFAWLFYRTRVRCDERTTHAVEKNLAVAAALGLPVDSPRFPLAISDDERFAARALLQNAAAGAGVKLDEQASFTAILPGARWESKLWPAEKFAALVDELHARGAPPSVLLGAPSERPIAERIRAAARRSPVDLVGRTSLRELVALLDLSERVYCCDSGPMHIAAALGKPLVALFGPTDPARTGPYSATARVVTHPVPCAPCRRRNCPLGHHDCMQRLSLERVIGEKTITSIT